VGAIKKMPKRSLSGLLTILREHGVAKYKDKTIEVEFGDRAFLRDPMVDLTPEKNEPEIKKTPEVIDEEDLFYSSQKG
jgi:hypothetical protein